MNIIGLLAGFLPTDFANLLIAFVLALQIAYDRERATHIMGLRTFLGIR